MSSDDYSPIAGTLSQSLCPFRIGVVEKLLFESQERILCCEGDDDALPKKDVLSFRHPERIAQLDIHFVEIGHILRNLSSGQISEEQEELCFLKVAGSLIAGLHTLQKLFVVGDRFRSLFIGLLRPQSFLLRLESLVDVGITRGDVD